MCVCAIYLCICLISAVSTCLSIYISIYLSNYWFACAVLFIIHRNMYIICITDGRTDIVDSIRYQSRKKQDRESSRYIKMMERMRSKAVSLTKTSAVRARTSSPVSRPLACRAAKSWPDPSGCDSIHPLHMRTSKRRVIWGFPKVGKKPNSRMVYFMENPIQKWMMTGGTPMWVWGSISRSEWVANPLKGQRSGQRILALISWDRSVQGFSPGTGGKWWKLQMGFRWIWWLSGFST